MENKKEGHRDFSLTSPSLCSQPFALSLSLISLCAPDGLGVGALWSLRRREKGKGALWSLRRREKGIKEIRYKISEVKGPAKARI